MSFKVCARTVLQLGEELISSDGIAFYELIKNAIDASYDLNKDEKRVDIDVIIRLSHEKYMEFDEEINTKLKRNTNPIKLRPIKENIISYIDSSAPKAKELKDEIREAGNYIELLNVLNDANYITFEDFGRGMSKKDLEDIYLTIGTPVKYKERERQKELFRKRQYNKNSNFSPILGEKGLGRLSAMRLGLKLHVTSKLEGEKYWNRLDIDWRKFSEDIDDMIEDVNIKPYIDYDEIVDSNEKGTLVFISELSTDWSKKKLEDIAEYQFSKLSDPFTLKAKFPIRIKFNGQKIIIPQLDKLLFKAAHAKVEAEYQITNDEVFISGKVNYRLRNREKSFKIDLDNLCSITEINKSILKSLGPFKMQLYWFNRKKLEAVDGIGTFTRVKELVNQWSGGLMVFRDGYRVNPYGDPDDDWLDLDRRALASGGYKVNRKQIIGKVDISYINNPLLLDQSNREGFRKSPEKEALVKILKNILESEFRGFLNKVDKEIDAQIPVSLDGFAKRVGEEEKRLLISLKLLKRKYPEVKKDKEIFNSIEESINQIRKFIGEANLILKKYKKSGLELTHLAGLGLMVEILAHELNRTVEHTLKTIGNYAEVEYDNKTASIFKTLESQLKTLQRRLSILDPLATAKRQVKGTFDLIVLIKDVIGSHNAQFQRHNIVCKFKIKPNINKFNIKMVEGMFVQILENLISNSVYWLKQKRKRDISFKPQINIILNTTNRVIKFFDNGPGVDYNEIDIIFEPFFTRKPPGEGKGLGLYISKEIARYHDAKIYLSDENLIKSEKLNTFILDFGEKTNNE